MPNDPSQSPAFHLLERRVRVTGARLQRMTALPAGENGHLRPGQLGRTVAVCDVCRRTRPVLLILVRCRRRTGEGRMATRAARRMRRKDPLEVRTEVACDAGCLTVGGRRHTCRTPDFCS